MSQTPPPQEPGNGSPSSAVAACWGDTAEARRRAPLQGWLDSPLVLREYVHPRLYGRAEGNWLAGVAQRLGIAAAGHWLSLGCGGAGAEIRAARDGLFASMVALDVADRAVESARSAAAAAGIGSIEFGVADLNRLTLPAATYDVVMMSMALHHVAALESLFAAVRTTLRPGGIFLVNEFVGPRQLQFTDQQLAIVRDLLGVLPERLRMDSATGQLKTEYVRLPVEHWNYWDPSEAVRSDEIVPLLHRHFHVVLQIDYGGTLLNPLLEHIVHNFDPGNEADVALIRMLARFEALAIRHGVVANDFTVMAMRVPAVPARRRWRWRRRRG
jgi:ubiquinone/menaquinone biosynthesis C-methylase UbiE